ncbi:hypothetical protein ACT29H_01775 [Thermophagus sp. OGC60D27]|uniref:hypothetical protein n=1 Tax=Thermophagus sp. OGC60D27 TaxID=3458415 RepID=UPI00403827F1
MKRFAKLIELQDGIQVLAVMKEKGVDEYVVQLRTDFDDVIAKIDVKMKSETDAYKYIDGFEKQHAINFRDDMSKYLE